MTVIHYWIQLENRKWDASPANIDRMTGQQMLAATGYTPTVETLNTLVPGSAPRNVTMFNPVRSAGVAVDALILRRYKPPAKPDQSDAWTVPDDRKINPWDLNERNPGENGTRGTIPGPTLEMSIGDSIVLHFKNADARSDWDVHARTHSLHPHGVVFAASSDGAFPLSPPDPAQATGAEAPLWAAVGVTGSFKQGDRVPPGGTFDYTWNTVGWPTTAGVWLYHDHSVNDMDNVELGAIGMINIHNPADLDDVDVRKPTPEDPTAYDPALMPGGSPTGSPIVRLPFLPPVTGNPIPVVPGVLERLGTIGSASPVGMPGMGSMGEKPGGPTVEGTDPPVDDSTLLTPEPIARGRAVSLGPNIVAELTPDLIEVGRLFLSRYRIPPQEEVIMQLYHTLHGVGTVINARHWLGNTPTVVAGVNTKMRFGMVGMGSMFHTFHLHGHRWILPGPHGNNPTAQQFSPMDTPVSQFEDTRTFGPANSFVFTINGQAGSFMRAGGPAPNQALGEWHMHCHVLDHMMSGMMGSLLIVLGGELAVALPRGIPPGQSTGGGAPGTQIVHLTSSPSFSPSNLMVNAGDTVQWVWDDNTAHTVTSDTGVWDSGALSGPPAPTFSRVFSTPGTFPYHCQLHAMNATITVM